MRRMLLQGNVNRCLLIVIAHYADDIPYADNYINYV